MAPPKRAFCKNGHARTPENVTSSRACRTCWNAQGRERDRARYLDRRGPLKGHRNGRKTHCKYGHEFTPENTYLTSKGVRQCRACRAARVRARTQPRVYTGEDRVYAELVRSDPCAYCGGPGGTADHIDPLDAGGGNVWENLTGACPRCNSSKLTKPLLTFLLEVA